MPAAALSRFTLLTALSLCAGAASANSPRLPIDGALTIAQNPPDATPPAADEQGKERKKGSGEAPGKGPPGHAPAHVAPGGQPQPPGQGQLPLTKKPQAVEKPPLEKKQRTVKPPLEAAPQLRERQPQHQAEPETTRRRRDESPAQGVPPGPDKAQKPARTTPFAPVPQFGASPVTPQRPAQTAPSAPVGPYGAAPIKPQRPAETVPFAPVPPSAKAPAAPPQDAQRGTRPSTTEPGYAKRARLPQAPPPQGGQPGFSSKFTPGFQPPGQAALRLQDLQKTRTQRSEEGGRRTVIEEPDNRVIVRQDNRIFVRHDETGRLATRARDVRSQRRADGTTETVIMRSGGVQVHNVVDGGGRLIRRYRRDERGREVDIIDNRRFYQGVGAGVAIAVGVGLAAEILALNLPPPDIRIPRDKYIVDYDRASDDDLYEALTAPPVDRLDRSYSLEEVRYNYELRNRMRRIDLDTINFEFGAWDVAPDQFRVLARIARAINRAVDRNPQEVFLIEGNTDAVGSDIDNLSLSDRRAQSVAEILTEDFDVPPENLVTQGYGEEFLKIPTAGPERANRRVAVRRITPLMAYDQER